MTPWPDHAMAAYRPSLPTPTAAAGAAQRRRGAIAANTLAAAALAAACCLPCAHAQGSGLNHAGPQPVSRDQFRANVARLMGLTVACGASAANCNPKAVGDDQQVAAAAAAPAFVMHWDWLRDALQKAQDSQSAHAGQSSSEPPYDRPQSMQQAYAHLQAIAADVAPPQAIAQANAQESAAADFAKARTEASAVLGRPEFQDVVPASWWQRTWTRWAMDIYSVFNNVGKLGKAAPWLGTLLEVLLYLAAAVGLVFFVLRTFARQRLSISLGAGAGKLDAWDREATDWAQLAETYAAQQQWRDAVHCLYWAAIVGLESRRAWRHNPARTPREYVRLLQPGSTQQGALRGLTQIFERVWYGLRDADRADYQRARGLLHGLTASPPHATPDPQRPSSPPGQNPSGANPQAPEAA